MDKIEHKEIVDYATTNAELVIARMPINLNEMEVNLPAKLRASKLNPLKKLSRLYEAMDKMAEYLHDFTACSSGCSNCCHYPVSVSSVESEYIRKNEAVKFNKNASTPNTSIHKGVPCIFLEGDKCSIYRSRPFACRNYVSIAATNKSCDVKYAFEYSLPIIALSGFKEAYDSIRIQSGDAHAPCDIRDVFTTK